MQLSVPRRSCSRLVIPRVCPMRALLRARLRRQPTGGSGCTLASNRLAVIMEFATMLATNKRKRASPGVPETGASAISISRSWTHIWQAESSRHGRRWVHSSRRCRQPRAYLGGGLILPDSRAYVSNCAAGEHDCAANGSRRNTSHLRVLSPIIGGVTSTTRYNPRSPFTVRILSTMSPCLRVSAFCGSWPRLYVHTRGSDRM